MVYFSEAPFLPAYLRVGTRNPKLVEANGSERNKFSVFATTPSAWLISFSLGH